MKDRIRAIMEMYNMTQQTFAQKLNLSPAAISSIFTGRTNPTNNHIQAIHKAFPEVSTNWVLFGEGEMLDSSSASSAVEASTEISQNFGSFGNAGSDIGASLFENEIGTSLFSEQSVPSSKVIPTTVKANTHAAVASAVALQQIQREMAKNIDKPQRKIKEIRVFFDDGTFEAFSPVSK